MGVVRGVCFGAAVAVLTVSSAAAQTSSGPWRSIGPDGGSVFAIVSDPVYPNIVHVATDGGGVFRSTDSGVTWRPVSGLPAGVTPALVIAPSNHFVLYAGTKDHGIFTSTDGGASWSATATPGRNVFDAARPPEVDALAVDPHDPHVVYATIGGNAALLYKSTNGGAAWSPVGALAPSSDMPRANGIRIDPAVSGTMYLFGTRRMLKTVDAGQTWTQIGPVFTEFLEPHDLQIDPQHPAVLYASLGVRGIYKSTDRGASWVASNAGIPAGSAASDVTLAGLAIDSRDGTIYAAALCRPSASCVEGAVFKSTDAATTWTPAHVLRGGWNSAVVAVTRSTPPTLFDGSRCDDVSVAPGPHGASNLQCPGSLFRSTNGGSSWDDASSGITSQATVDVVADPLDPAVLVATTRRGIFRSADGGATWSVRPLALTGAKSLAAAPGARQMYAVVDEGSTDVVYASNDHGQTWFFTTSTGLGDPDSLHEVQDLAVAPFTALADRLYAAAFSGLFTSVDGGFNWTKLSGTFVSTLVAVRPGNPSVVFYTLSTTPQSSLMTQLYRSTDGGTSAAPVPLTGNVHALAFDPSDADTMYAALTPDFFCSTATQVFKSTDGGTTWTSASAGLPTSTSCQPHTSGGLVVDPSNPSRVFMGTNQGVFATADAGVHWSPWSGLADKTISSLAIAGSTLIAVARDFGGLFVNDLACPITTTPGAQSLSAAGGQVTVVVSAPAGCAWSAAADASFVSINASAGTGDGIATLTIAPNPGAPRSAAVTIGGVTVLVNQAATEIAADRTSLQFTATNNGAAFVSKTAAQALRLVQTGPGSVSWTAASNQPWLTVSQTAGAGTATLTVDVGHAPGMPISTTLTGSIVVTFTGIAQPAMTIPVTLTILPNGTSQAAFGAFDTPVNGIIGVAGSIPVTGWVLDDVGVTRVRIMRDPVAPEPAGALVFIGNAVFIDGARPDVQATFPSHPQHTRAGWGYLMLTNFLPNTGNGTFTIYAIADDAEGHSTVLGTKVITCDNANSIAPFGAIDTPRQGEVVSGSTYVNFGWALSPGARRADVPGGGTVSVFVDGVNLGTPGGWGARDDITTLFPKAQYDGTDFAVAGLAIDTTALANGVHTIHWGVLDNMGGGAGIGSRFFTVSNGSGLFAAGPADAATVRADTVAARAALDVPAAAVSRIGGRARTLTQEVDAAPADRSPIPGRRGYDPATPMVEYTPESGRITVHAEELDRIELHVPGASRHQITGYLRTIDGVAPLPVGSALDAATGTFTWGAGPGFVGRYDLAFVRWSGGRAVARHDVRIVLHPKGSNRVGPQVIVDLPAPTAQGRGPIVVGRAFFLAGWAADLDSGIDRGVDTVHVWAYPVNERGEREEPMFLGPAIYGGARPDVAAVYGDRFRDTGYGMVVTGLAPGAYDVAVFAFSTVRGNFAPAKVVRVIVR